MKIIPTMLHNKETGIYSFCLNDQTIVESFSDETIEQIFLSACMLTSEQWEKLAAVLKQSPTKAEAIELVAKNRLEAFLLNGSYNF